MNQNFGNTFLIVLLVYNLVLNAYFLWYIEFYRKRLEDQKREERRELLKFVQGESLDENKFVLKDEMEEQEKEVLTDDLINAIRQAEGQ